MNNNNQKGVYATGTTKPSSMQTKAENFLISHPMNFKILHCVFQNNNTVGASFQNYWKGEIIISSSFFDDNNKFGVELISKSTSEQDRQIKGPIQEAVSRLPSSSSSIMLSTPAINQKDSSSVKLDFDPPPALDNKLGH